jgi:hypothetical protein
MGDLTAAYALAEAWASIDGTYDANGKFTWTVER